ncbi:hypothetical protein D7X32_09425 [Corallococcus carmarthensis]|uniref:Uncharacterized protein n=1 Tax=Corallococcus carmarthensis TaxID=2316728 RepID=A0A3A8KSK7_9BACT|nr:hypothetical protein D7X32_09425 [Corallococcus carmarthensis]
MLMVGCGGLPPEEAEAFATSSASLTDVNAVRPNAAVARAGVRGVPDDVNLVNDVKDTVQPDFDATYIEGNGSSSSVDFSYPAIATGDVLVTSVNVKYFMRNASCTAPLICGQGGSMLLRGNTVIAWSTVTHNLPDMTQGWYLFNDTYTLSPPVPLSQLRTRVTMTWPGRSTYGMRLSTVAADFRY